MTGSQQDAALIINITYFINTYAMLYALCPVHYAVQGSAPCVFLDK